MAYCKDCGAYAALDDADMCDRCRSDWRPAGPVLADLGCRNPHASARSDGQSPDL